MTLKVRHATSNDIPALATLHVQTFNETHLRGRSGGPSYELREHQWRDAFADTNTPWFLTSMLLFGDAQSPANGFYEASGLSVFTATPVNFTEATAGGI